MKLHVVGSGATALCENNTTGLAGTTAGLFNISGVSPILTISDTQATDTGGATGNIGQIDFYKHVSNNLVARIAALHDAGDDYYGSALAFYTKVDGGATAMGERMRITNGGYVGIGTTTPGYGLEVNGTARIN